METAIHNRAISSQRVVPTFTTDARPADADEPGKQSIKTDRTLGGILTGFALNLTGALLALLFVAVFHSETPPGQLAREFIDSFIYANFIGTLVIFAVFSLTPRLMLSRFPLNWILLVSMILTLTFVGSLMAGFALMGLGLFPPRDYSWIGLRRMGLGFLLALGFGVGGHFYERVRLRFKATSEQLRAKALDEERARKLAVEASLSSLESRIHPHFLFNTLNSISALIQDDPFPQSPSKEEAAGFTSRHTCLMIG